MYLYDKNVCCDFKKAGRNDVPDEMGSVVLFLLRIEAPGAVAQSNRSVLCFLKREF